MTRSKTAIACALISSAIALAQTPGSLKRVAVPQPSNLSQYVQSNEALVLLGKALFWDMQTGSDGKTACASCHFHAGADHRLEGQLAKAPQQLIQALKASDFPFHALSNPNSNASAVLRDTPAIAGSAGLFRRVFRDVVSGNRADDGVDALDAPDFTVNGVNVRQVTGRNTPSVINAVFNFRNFWDGRASNVFTGATPFGDSDNGLNAVAIINGELVRERVRMENSSLASQSVGPPLNGVEMSYDGRTWPLLGRKMLSLRPLAMQRIAPDDSVLGSRADESGRGFTKGTTYLDLVKAAFRPAYWDSAKTVDAAGGPYSAAEFNFSIFWGLALQAYESTLISNDSRVDRFFDGDTGALTALEQAGLREFQGRGSNCTNCHTGPELTLAGITGVNQRGLVQAGGGGRGGNNVDTGFFRTGVRVIGEDVGLGALDGFSRPLSAAVAVNPARSNAVQGLFKTPGLRDVEFTGPYFHNGGQATLEQVVDFYGRGGDFPAGGNLGPGIGNRNFSAAEKQQLVAFMKALSDDRVKFERAPFDHPELCVPVGVEKADATSPRVDGSDPRFAFSAAERWAGLPAIGRSGNQAPLQTYEELLNGVGADGSRTHTLQDACTVPLAAAPE